MERCVGKQAKAAAKGLATCRAAAAAASNTDGQGAAGGQARPQPAPQEPQQEPPTGWIHATALCVEERVAVRYIHTCKSHAPSTSDTRQCFSLCGRACRWTDDDEVYGGAVTELDLDADPAQVHIRCGSASLHAELTAQPSLTHCMRRYDDCETEWVVLPEDPDGREVFYAPRAKKPRRRR